MKYTAVSILVLLVQPPGIDGFVPTKVLFVFCIIALPLLAVVIGYLTRTEFTQAGVDPPTSITISAGHRHEAQLL